MDCQNDLMIMYCQGDDSTPWLVDLMVAELCTLYNIKLNFVQCCSVSSYIPVALLTLVCSIILKKKTWRVVVYYTENALDRKPFYRYPMIHSLRRVHV